MNLEALLARIEGSLEALERAPRMWGDPEAQELQVLLLIDLRQELVRPAALAADPFESRRAYQRFVRSVNGEPTSTFLHCILRDEVVREGGKVKELSELLGDFGRWMAREYPPEKPE